MRGMGRMVTGLFFLILMLAASKWLLRRFGGQFAGFADAY